MSSLKLDRLFLGHLAQEVATKDDLEKAADSVKGIAESTAPVGTGYYWSKGRGWVYGGHYKDKFKVEVDDEGNVYLTNFDFKARWIEWGIPGLGRPAQSIIRRAVHSAGIKLVEQR